MNIEEFKELRDRVSKLEELLGIQPYDNLSSNNLESRISKVEEKLIHNALKYGNAYQSGYSK
jgi:hypothetical protein